MPDEGYLGMAIDRDPADGSTPRLVRTISSMPTELLETGIFDDLAEDERRTYLSGIVRMAHGPELMTPAGIRSRSLRHADALPYPDYHGVQSCWGVSNSIYAMGLARQGFGELAGDVATRHIDALGASGALHEFLYVDLQGWVRHPLLPMLEGAPEEDVLAGTNDPETDQAWTVSFALRILMQGETATGRAEGWRKELTREVLAKDNHVALRPAYLDRERAVVLEAEVVARGPSANR
jgi:glycogen debranching enzyme